jgi:glycosyltransferase involved in cell wall biosynthesis
MIEGHLIICDSNVPWQGNRYSKHHLMSRLARHNDVVFMNPQVDACKYGREKGWRGVWNLGARFEQPADEALQVFTPLSLPYRGESRHLLAADQRYFTRQVRAVVKRYPGRDLILFIGNPWNVFLLDAFPECKCSIYHCSDDFPSLFGGGLGEKIAEREEKLIRSVDLAMCSHKNLLNKCLELGGRAHYLSHAVDERFLRKGVGTGCPEEIRSLPHPRIVLMGSLDVGLDCDLLRQTGEDYPEASFVFIGKIDDRRRDTFERLLQAPNMHWLGPKPWAELPEYLWSMDVAIIPYVVDNFAECRSPLKLFEYLAAGLPVVSTTAPPEEDFVPYVIVARGHEQFKAGIGEAVARGEDQTRRETQVALMGEKHTWDRRVTELEQAILSVEARRAAL